MAEGIHTLIQSVYDDSILQGMFTDGHEPKVKENPLNENFAKKEFQALWNEINRKYAYTVEFDSEELIKKAVDHINEKLFVSELQYTTTVGRQKAKMDEYEVERGASFGGERTRTQTLKHAQTSQIKYDLIGKVAEGTVLTRRTAARILKGLSPEKLAMFRHNPEEFISKVIRLIKEQKATMIVEHISYDQIEGAYDSTIFTAEKIAFYEGTVKHIFFVAETKGTMESLNLRPIEQAKISCAKKLFNEMSTSKVKYHDVDSYQSLLNVMRSL